MCVYVCVCTESKRAREILNTNQNLNLCEFTLLITLKYFDIRHPGNNIQMESPSHARRALLRKLVI